MAVKRGRQKGRTCLARKTGETAGINPACRVDKTPSTGPDGEKGSRPVSRVLSRTVIHLGCASPRTSCDLPGNSAGHLVVPLFGLAPGGVCHAAECCHPRGALLPHPFTLAGAMRRLGGLLSAALSVGSRRPGVTWHPALWSPDFPPCPKAQRLSGRLPRPFYQLHALNPFPAKRQRAGTRRSSCPP